MDTRDNIGKHVIKMAALGRQFQLGDLYNYHNDLIVTSECRLWWESADLPSATQTETEFQLKLLRPDSETSNKWERMELNEHLQASILGGFLGKLHGAGCYVNEQSNPAYVTQTLICRARSKKECLDLPTLLNHNVLTISVDGKIPDATHVVVGVEYGAEAYCVLAEDVPEKDENAREASAAYLDFLSSTMENALEEQQDVTEFKKNLDEGDKRLVRQLKCRVYADLQSQPVRECSLFDAYKYCSKLIHQVKSGKAVPAVVFICPLKIVIDANGRLEKMFRYRDVDAGLVDRCCRIWTELEQVISRSESLRLSFKETNHHSLRQFAQVVFSFQDLLKASWKKGIAKARENENENDDEVEKAANIAETHPLFKISRMNQWLLFKQSELEMAGKLDSFNGITFLASNTELEKELGDSFDKKFALVLNVPQLDERTKEIFGTMKDYVDNYTRLVADYDGSDEDGKEYRLPWHMVIRKRKQVLDMVREMADHVEKNKHLENKVQFFVTPEEGSKKFGCRYSVYQENKLLKDNLSQLPTTPPTGLRIQLDTKRSKMSSIKLEWDYEELGYPCTFLVEYRPIDDPEASWKQKKTSKPSETHMTLILRQDSVFEIRVAAETCIGRSEFSELVDTELITMDVSRPIDVEEMFNGINPMPEAGPILSIQSVSKSISCQKKIVLLPPTKLVVAFITQTTAEVAWTPSTSCTASSVAFSYNIRYWRNGQRSSVHVNVDSNQTKFLLEDLQPGTTYSIDIIAKSEDGQESAPSDAVEFTTQRQDESSPKTVGIDELNLIIEEMVTNFTTELKETKRVVVETGRQLNERIKESITVIESIKENTDCVTKRVHKTKSMASMSFESKMKLMEISSDIDRLKTKISKPLLHGEAKIAMEKKWFDAITKANLSVEELEELIENGADINARDDDGRTALFLWCWKYDNIIDVIRFFCQNGADVNAKDNNGSAAFHFLCQHYKNGNIIDVVRLLVKNGVHVNDKNTWRFQALHYLCQNYKNENIIDVIRFLVKKGADVNAKENSQWTALHYLCQNYKHTNIIDIVRFFIENGMDVTAKTNSGKTAHDLLSLNYDKENLNEILNLLRK